MQVEGSSEMVVNTTTIIWCKHPDDQHINLCCHENLKPQKNIVSKLVKH